MNEDINHLQIENLKLKDEVKDANRDKFETITKLKDQIEKMKCCENCKFVSVVIGCVKNELMEGLSSNSKGYCKCDKWELAE